MSENLEDIYEAFLNNQVPHLWSKSSYLSMKSLGSWINDLVLRIEFYKHWIFYEKLDSYWLPAFFHPQGFLTGILQNHARKYKLPIDQLNFHFQVKAFYLSQVEFSKYLKEAAGNDELPTLNLPKTRNGVHIHGLFLDAADFDILTTKLCDAQPGVINPPLPVLHVEPDINYEPSHRHYLAPLYKTAERAGTLSTTGHSSNFIIAIPLPSTHSQSFWIKRGTAILCQITE
ncbi:dynein axonemal heavy chain 6-like [Centruroides vittatus]|uniref:dynein axonemal heavy chain 6-like n=1 Tax=Centruroides vittatus TaxID=120091 RepID=UPI0035101D37